MVKYINKLKIYHNSQDVQRLSERYLKFANRTDKKINACMLVLMKSYNKWFTVIIS